MKGFRSIVNLRNWLPLTVLSPFLFIVIEKSVVLYICEEPDLSYIGLFVLQQKLNIFFRLIVC